MYEESHVVLGLNFDLYPLHAMIAAVPIIIVVD